jgi:hypothetical protein
MLDRKIEIPRDNQQVDGPLAHHAANPHSPGILPVAPGWHALAAKAA